MSSVISHQKIQSCMIIFLLLRYNRAVFILTLAWPRVARFAKSFLLPPQVNLSFTPNSRAYIE